MTIPENTQEPLLSSEPASEEAPAPAAGEDTGTLPSVEEQFPQLELQAPGRPVPGLQLVVAGFGDNRGTQCLDIE